MLNSGQNKSKSFIEGIIFSIPTTAICTFGKVVLSLALPSFSVMEILPVSAIKKLAPVIPADAVVYFARNNSLALSVSASGLASKGVSNFS